MEILKNPDTYKERYINKLINKDEKINRPKGVKKFNPLTNKKPVKLKRILENITAPDKDHKF